MLRFAAGAGSAILLMLAGFFIWQSAAHREPVLPEAPAAAAAAVQQEPAPESEPRPKRPPSADARTKEQRRFDRADKDKNGRIVLDELYQPRRKAFARLDANGDGRLSFEEWAVRTSTKFKDADSNRDRQLTREEYATTAPKPRAPRTGANCAC